MTITKKLDNSQKLVVKSSYFIKCKKEIETFKNLLVIYKIKGKTENRFYTKHTNSMEGLFCNVNKSQTSINL